MVDLERLMAALSDEVILRQESDKTEELSEVFLESIQKTLREIKTGADSDDFSDLSVINFIILADSLGYDHREISNFVKSLNLVDSETEE